MLEPALCFPACAGVLKQSEFFGIAGGNIAKRAGRRLEGGNRVLAGGSRRCGWAGPYTVLPVDATGARGTCGRYRGPAKTGTIGHWLDCRALVCIRCSRMVRRPGERLPGRAPGKRSGARRTGRPTGGSYFTMEINFVLNLPPNARAGCW